MTSGSLYDNTPSEAPDGPKPKHNEEPRIVESKPYSGRPIRPDEVVHLKEASIPPEVFDAFNELIALKFDGKSAYISQKAVIAKILSKFEGNVTVSRTTIFDKHWLDVEDVYCKAGWTVKYDKPGWNETYEANFTFTK